MASTTVAKQGRRFYLQGLPYEQRGRAKALGCKWDRDAKAWWTGKVDVTEKVAEAANGDAPQSSPVSSPSSDRPAPGDDATVAARATYKGRIYYVGGRIVRGRTQWDDTVEAISTRDGAKWLLYFRDGAKSFWAPREMVQLVKSYDRPQTIAGLRRFADRAKREGFAGGEYCYHACPVGGFKCCPENGPCHDCE